MLMGEFVTAVKYNLPLKIMTVKNNSLGQIRWEKMVFLGNPECVCDPAPINFAEFARARGGIGFTIEDPEECAVTLNRAFATPGPLLMPTVVQGGRDPKISALLMVENRAEDAGRIEAGKAQPIDGPVLAYGRHGPEVADDAVVLNGLTGHLAAARTIAGSSRRPRPSD
jgi:pyruvate dehydrogenase (quinone)